MNLVEIDPIIDSDNHIFSYGDVLKPVSTLESVKFAENVRVNLFKARYGAIFPLQRYSWGEVMAKRSLLMIGNGKTIGYLPSLLSNVLGEQSTYMAERKGPTAIIFAKSAKSVEELKALCNKLVTEPKLSIVTATCIWNIQSKVLAVLNGCDLLITTPACFERLTKFVDLKIIDPKDVSTLVFDDFDCMYEQHGEKIRGILSQYRTSGSDGGGGVQFILTATKWKDSMQALIGESIIRILLIANFIEAAVMARSRFNIVIERAESKDMDLLARLEDNSWRHRRTLVLFSSSGELQHFKRTLQEYGGPTTFTAVDSDCEARKALCICRQWQNEPRGMMSLLLMTDETYQNNLPEIYLVKDLIHYSLPQSWTNFCRRFAASIEHYMNNVREMCTLGKSKRSTVTILLDDKNTREFPRLINFLHDRRVIKQLPDNVVEKIAVIKRSFEEAKMGKGSEHVPLCSSFLKFAHDSSDCNCKWRHAFTTEDKPSPHAPTRGRVKFHIVAIIDPLHYSVKITHTNDSGPQWISNRDSNEETESALNQLQKYMNKNENNIAAGIIKVGELYCFKHLSLNQWFRCRVVAIKEGYDHHHHSLSKQTAKILLIDRGESISADLPYIRHLPDDFKKCIPLVCNLRITNMTPIDSETFFDRETVNRVENKIRESQRNSDYFICNIDLAVSNIIFTKNIYAVKHSRALKLDLYQFEMKKFLLENDFAIVDESIFNKILKSAETAGLMSENQEHRLMKDDD